MIIGEECDSVKGCAHVIKNFGVFLSRNNLIADRVYSRHNTVIIDMKSRENKNVSLPFLIMDVVITLSCLMSLNVTERIEFEN